MGRSEFPHAVAKLRAIRQALSTKAFLARGHRVKRCPRCRIAQVYCICHWQPHIDTHAGICLLMYDSEPFKPSNTGWLIADIVQEIFAFSWLRMGDMEELITLINAPQWQAYVVFPEEYAQISRVTHQVIVEASSKKPLFIILDGTWTEARKMFRKSPYLNHLPVLSFKLETLSRYKLRHSSNQQHFCTAEIGALCLALAREERAARALEGWFDLFTTHYVASKQNKQIEGQDSLYSALLSLNDPVH